MWSSPWARRRSINKDKNRRAKSPRKKGRIIGSARARAKRRRGRGRGNKNLPLALFASPKASEKWYITTKHKPGKSVHVVSVYNKNCPRYAAIAQDMFDHLQSHPSTTQEEAIAMRDRQMQ